jgi:hypothetical protein
MAALIGENDPPGVAFPMTSTLFTLALVVLGPADMAPAPAAAAAPPPACHMLVLCVLVIWGLLLSTAGLAASPVARPAASLPSRG